MSAPLVRFPTNRATRVLVLGAYLLLLTFSCWGLWLQLTVDWDTQWSYADMWDWCTDSHRGRGQGLRRCRAPGLLRRHRPRHTPLRHLDPR